jgi:hypothetical protein
VDEFSPETGFSPHLDFEWYAVDRDGHVAFLTSAGFGPVPAAVFGSEPAYRLARDFFRSLPERCEFIADLPDDLGRAGCWIDAARRGLYPYDWNARQSQPLPRRPYRRLAIPAAPLAFADLPAEVQGWLEAVRFGQSEFARAEELWPDRAFADVCP